MAETIRIEDLAKRLEKYAKDIPRTVAVGVRRVIMGAVADVTRNRMSFPRSGPPVPRGLRLQTGTAVKSVSWIVEPQTDRIVGRFGSPLKYVRAHEVGFSGDVNVRAHERRLATNKREEKRRLKSGRKLTAQVRAHRRSVNMVARRFFKDTLKSSGPSVEPTVRRSLKILAETGRVPNIGDL